MGALDGMTALITGGSRGLGRAVAEAYLREGADIAICARDACQLGITQGLLQRVFPDRTVFAIPCDVTDWNRITDMLVRLHKSWDAIDILVNNAGEQGPVMFLPAALFHGWCRTFGVNVECVGYLMASVASDMLQKHWGKVINISGGGATKPQPGLSAYAASKAALVRLTETVALELRGTGIDVNAVAPGALDTRMQGEIIAAGPGVVGEARYQEALNIKETGGDSIEEAAALCVWLASHASDGLSGKLISAQHDDWRNLDIPKVMASDWGTLRRVTE